MKETLRIIQDTIIEMSRSPIENKQISFVIQNFQEENSQIYTNIITIFLATIAGMIALYQVKLNIISSARISWIENLRNTVSEYYSETDNITTILINMKDDGIEDLDKGIDKWYTQYLDACKRYHNLAAKLRLYLNTIEHNHKQIEDNIDKITHILEKRNIGEINSDEIELYLSTIIKFSKYIFKEEWSKSKNIFRK